MGLCLYVGWSKTSERSGVGRESEGRLTVEAAGLGIYLILPSFKRYCSRLSLGISR